MKEYIEEKIQERRLNEVDLVRRIGQMEQEVIKMKATLISVRGGILELTDLLNNLKDAEVKEVVEVENEEEE
ncbi:hypothetical protein KAR91_70410 [Candidatus Pacearchaeota archaeon]|nr:hypothetical protein [Candidatus Pacearchaeota archaeon]